MTTRFQIDGLGDVGSLVVPKQTELEMALGGAPSIGVITIRDQGLDPVDFITGKRITVDRGTGTDPIWSGYLLRPARRFWFDVDKPDTMQRQWRLSVVDINWLFTKRVVFKVADPETIKGPLYTADTYDDDVIDELVTNWLDLSTDDIDVTSRVSRVGHINAGQQAYPFNAGMMWRDAMVNIAQLPAAIFGLDAQRRLVYADVDDENAPFALSDLPGPANAGYREMQLWHDGQRLINDALCWGFGLGGENGVFERLEDSASIDTHGLWQDAITSYSIWKQSTIDKVADSIINGSPESKRGGKNDRVWVKCVTYRDGLALGDRVRFISNIWGFEDVMPIRKVHLRFPTPDDVRYELEISHDIDRWGFEDPQPPLPGYLIPPIDIPIIEIPEPPFPEECGITDTWTRTVAPDAWGTCDAGILWSVAGADTTAEVDGAVGILTTPGSGPGGNSRAGSCTIAIPSMLPATMEVMFRTNLSQSDATGSMQVAAIDLTNASPFRAAHVAVEHRVVGVNYFTNLHFVAGIQTPERITCPISIAPNVWYHLKFRVTPSVTLGAKVWADGDPEPVSYTETSVLTVSSSSAYSLFTLGHVASGALDYDSTGRTLITEFDDLDVADVNDCVTPAPLSGPYCETINHGGSATLALARAFIPGSERVYINGLLQLPGVNYTPDGPGAEIVLDDAPALSAIVYVCYLI